MGCWACARYSWDDRPSVVYRGPNNGSECCAFHAPLEHRYKELGKTETYTDHEYSLLVLERIRTAVARVKNGEHDAECNLRGAFFPDNMVITRFLLDGEFPIMNFAHATFLGDVHFLAGEFNGQINFDNATFLGTAYFTAARFLGEASFQEAKFAGGAWFTGAEFRGKARFNRARFAKENHFDENAYFGGPVIFGDCVDFREATCEASGSIIMANLAGSSLKHLTFALDRLPLFTFSNCRWPDRLGLDLHGYGDAENHLECELLYRAMKKRATDEHDQFMAGVWNYREKLMSLKQLIDVKGLQQGIAKVLRLTKEESPALMRCVRGISYVLSMPRLLFSLTFWYWVVSGFGERMGRAGVWLALLTVLPFIWSSSLLSLPADLEWSLPSGLRDVSNVMMAMEFIPFTKDIAGTGWLRVGQGIWHLFLIIQSALFAMAVRNHFRR